VLDEELDQVYMASEATRRSKLITGFIRAAQNALPSSDTASARTESAAPGVSGLVRRVLPAMLEERRTT